MTTTYSLLSAVGLSLSALCATAQTHTDSLPTSGMTLATNTADEIRTETLKNSHKILLLPASGTDKASDDSIMHLISRFYVDQYRHFQDPLAPYFLFMSKDAKLAMGIGGAVRMRGWSDFGGSIPTNGFIPYMIPVPKDPSQRRKLDGTPDGTSLFLRIIGRNRLLGDIVCYVQGNFQGDGHTFKLKKAYTQFMGFTIGYAPSMIEDSEAEAPTIDGAGQNGLAKDARMLVRWDRSFRNSPWSMAACLEMPRSRVGSDDMTTQALSDWFPDILAFGQYNWADGSHVRFTGMMRVLPYRDLVSGKNRNRIGWMAQISGVVYPMNRLALYCVANTGQGYASLLTDLAIGKFDLVAEPDIRGRMYAPFALGLNIGAKYNFRHNLFAGLALSESRYFPRLNVKDSTYKYGMYGAINLFYEPTPRIQVGIEYLIGKRRNFNGEQASANRIDALFQFSF